MSTTPAPATVSVSPRLRLPQQAFGVTRRFGVIELLSLVTLNAGLFAVLRAVGSPAWMTIVVAGLFVAVAVGQLLLYDGRRPRDASILAGAIYFTGPLAVAIVGGWLTGEPIVRLPGIYYALIMGTICGGWLGYVAGALIGGAFLAAERMKKLRPPR